MIDIPKPSYVPDAPPRKERGLKPRTIGEMQAYIDGYNACAEWLESYLIREQSVDEALRKLGILKDVVNSVMRKYE